MHILIVDNGIIPASKYGGTERVIWGLGKALVQLGHQVSFLVASGSTCAFAKILILDQQKTLASQIPDGVDLVHLNFQTQIDFDKPYLITQHGNYSTQIPLDINTVFVSKNHAQRHGSQCFVHNGLDWSTYPKVDLSKVRKGFHFLGNAAWKVKNLKGAVQIIKKIPNQYLQVLGGTRLNLKMGIKFTWSHKTRFKGMVNDVEKAQILQQSKGLIFPVLWHEPFGLAMIESLYYGSPVFGTPKGSLPELITKDYGFLSQNYEEIAQAMQNLTFDEKKCHEYASEQFNAQIMTKNYLKIYEKVLKRKTLNTTQPVLEKIEWYN